MQLKAAISAFPLAVTDALTQLGSCCQTIGPVDICNSTSTHLNDEMLNIQHRVQRRFNVRHCHANRAGRDIRYRKIQRIHRLRLILRLLKRHRYSLRVRGPGNIGAPEDQHATLIGFSGADNTDRATLFAPHGNAIVSGAESFLA